MKQDTITLAEAAKELRVSYLSAYNMVLKGTLDGSQVEGHWRVKRDSVRRYLRRQYETANRG